MFHSQKLCIQFPILLYNQKLFKTKLSMNLGVMIKWGNQVSLQDRAKTLIFLRHHLHEGLIKNELLMRNHQSRPTRSESFPKMNAILSQTRGRWRERGCGGGRNPRHHGSYSNNSPNSQKRKASLHHQKWNNTEVKQENGKCLRDKTFKNHENNCYRCGMKGHWSRTYRMPKHLSIFTKHQ